MKTHDQIVKALLRRPAVRAEVERIAQEEGELLDALLKARHDAGLSQAQVATLRKYADACGKQLILRVA